MSPRIAAEFCKNEIGFDEDNEAFEAVLPPDLDTDAQILAEAADIGVCHAELALAWMRQRQMEEIRHAAGDALAALVAEIVPRSGKINLQVVGLRFTACRFLLNRSRETLTSLADRCGVSKQLLDYHANWLADRLGFHGFAQKRTEARASYAEAQRQSWGALTPEERKARRAGKQAAPAAQNATHDLTDTPAVE